MKRKFRILGNIGLALFLACALMLAVVPATEVEAATEVTNVWLEFPGAVSWTDSVGDDPTVDTSLNETSATANMIVHFTATTALKANIDTITIYFPDGSTELSGSGNADGTFTVTDATVGRSIAICVDPDGSGTTYGYYKINASATAAGYRLKLTTPIDIAAGAKPYVFISGDDCSITNSSEESSLYKIKMQTSKDTTLVLSPTFALGAAANTPTINTGAADTFVASPSIAGSGSTLTFSFDATAGSGLTAESGTVTVIFPTGTTVPSSIDAAQVECQNYTGTVPTGGGGYQACGTDPTVNSDARMVTLTVPVTITAEKGCSVRFKTGAGITLPQVITEQYYSSGETNYAYLDYYIYTSADRLMKKGTGGGAVTGNFKISPGAAYQLGFNNDAYYGSETTNTYSADCSIINGFTLALYLQMQDQYGNLVFSGTGSAVTVTLSATAGALYTSQLTTASTASQLLVDGEVDLYFRATSAGTHTITASYSGYESGTWDVTVAPAVELYDANLQLVNTFAPISTNTTPTLKGGYYVNEAVSAAMTGDTIRLGEGIYDVTSNIVGLDKAVTIEAVSGTTPVLRCTGTPNNGRINITKGATLDGLTFRGLRWTTDLDDGFIEMRAASATFFTIQNCTFEDYKAYMGIYWVDGSVAVTSASFSNNTFQNIIGDYARAPAVLWIEPAAAYAVSGVTISNNTFLNNAMMLINLCADGTITDVTISGNTISSNRSNEGGIDIYEWSGVLGSATAPIKVIDNEISGCMDQAIKVCSGTGSDSVFTTVFAGVRIKRNYIHDNAEEAIKVMGDFSAASTTTSNVAGVLEIMYNDIVDNANVSGIYAIENSGDEADATHKVTAQYNWFGDASGPTVTANVGGTGDTVETYVAYSPWLYKSRTDVVADNVAYDAARMNLVSGWNTLSTPVKLIEAADAVDELISAEDMTIGYYYDGGWQQITTGYVLSPCDAVYVKMNTTASPLLKFDAGAFTTPSKDLAVGWNMISLAYLASGGKKEKPAVASVALTAAGLPGYSQVISPSMNAAQTDLFGTTGTSWTYSYGEDATVGLNDMYAGLGYWIYMQNAATLAGFTITPITPDLD